MKMAGVSRAGKAPVRRVRHGVRDGLAVMAVSALFSVGLALVLALAVRLVVAAGN